MLLEDQTDQINQKDKKDKKDQIDQNTYLFKPDPARNVLKEKVDCVIIMQEVCYEPARNSR